MHERTKGSRAMKFKLGASGQPMVSLHFNSSRSREPIIIGELCNFPCVCLAGRSMTSLILIDLAVDGRELETFGSSSERHDHHHEQALQGVQGSLGSLRNLTMQGFCPSILVTRPFLRS